MERKPSWSIFQLLKICFNNCLIHWSLLVIFAVLHCISTFFKILFLTYRNIFWYSAIFWSNGCICVSVSLNLSFLQMSELEQITFFKIHFFFSSLNWNRNYKSEKEVWWRRVRDVASYCCPCVLIYGLFIFLNFWFIYLHLCFSFILPKEN